MNYRRLFARPFWFLALVFAIVALLIQGERKEYVEIHGEIYRTELFK